MEERDANFVLWFLVGFFRFGRSLCPENSGLWQWATS